MHPKETNIDFETHNGGGLHIGSIHRYHFSLDQPL